MEDLKVTRSLIAPTPEELSALTIRAQLNFEMRLKFFDFTQLQNGQYMCWYEVPLKIYQEKVLNGKT